MSAKVRVLGRPGCGACIFTKRALEAAGIDHLVLDVDADPDAAAAARRAAEATGSTQLPAVICPDGSTWSGLRMDRIADLVRQR